MLSDGIITFIAERILPHHPDSEKFRELVVDTTVKSVPRYVRSPRRLGFFRDWEFGLVPDEVHFIQIENLLFGADIEFKTDIHYSFSIVSVELCVGARLFANL